MAKLRKSHAKAGTLAQKCFHMHIWTEPGIRKRKKESFVEARIMHVQPLLGAPPRPQTPDIITLRGYPDGE